MKFLLALMLVVSTNAFAVDICSYMDTQEVNVALKAQDIKPVLVSNNHKKFTTVEKKLIHKTVTLQGWMKDISLRESLKVFGDFDGRSQGSDAGEILYYNIEGKQLILVHYWPGENEYGAYYSVNGNGSIKLIAEITDGFISCK